MNKNSFIFYVILFVCLCCLALTALAQGNTGAVWFSPAEQTVNKGDTFTTEVHINTGSQSLCAFGFSFYFNETVISLYTNPTAVTDLAGKFSCTVSTPTSSSLIISGFSASGIAPRTDIHLFTIHWKAVRSGASYIEIKVDSLSDINYDDIPAGTVTNEVVHVQKMEPLQGDVSSDGLVTIVDALKIAQYANGTNPPGFNTSMADVNCDGRINIVDALITAQYVTGLISSFPCEVLLPTPPAESILIEFPDSVLEKEIRMQIDKLTGEIYNTDVYDVEELLLSLNSIKDITGLEYFTSLKTLYLSYNSISDLTPLAALTKLRFLNLARNQLSDLTPLAALKELMTLDLSENTITDLTSLAGLNNLLYLYLNTNAINDLSPLAGLTSLRILNLEKNQVTGVAPLQALTQMRNLYLGSNTITDITALAGMTSLTSLKLSNNQISSITPLTGCTWLTNLEMNNNNIRDLTALSALTRLVRLYISHNNISDLSPLSGLILLQQLTLSLNQISDVSPLFTLTALTYMSLENNIISNVMPLTALINLQQVYLYENPISAEDIAMLKAALPDTGVNF